MPLPVDFIELASIPSTNAWAKEHLSGFNASHLTCITATEQTAGRGRRARDWVSPPGNLYVTLSLFIPTHAPYITNLGQLLTLACAEMLLSLNVPMQIKWPNDLFTQRKKMGGVLAETVPLSHHTAAILGLGLNVNMPKEILKVVGQPATSLHLVIPQPVEPLSLLEPLLSHFFPLYETLQKEGFTTLQPRFQELLAYRGETISIDLPHKRIHGICDSITATGCLKVRLPSGEFTILSIGDITGSR